jgi:hypothetical protein
MSTWSPPMSAMTQILSAVERGDPQAAEQLLPLVYKELRRLAARKLAHESPGQTFQATALVHEAYLRLVGDVPDRQWNGRPPLLCRGSPGIPTEKREGDERSAQHPRGSVVSHRRARGGDPPSKRKHSSP